MKLLFCMSLLMSFMRKLLPPRQIISHFDEYQDYQGLKKDYDLFLLQIVRKIKLFKDCKIVNKVLNLKSIDCKLLQKKYDMYIVERIDGEIDNPSQTNSPHDAHNNASANSGGSINDCKKGDVDGVAPSHALLASTAEIFLVFEKHAGDIRSPLLNKM
jgi:hypothetical protein